MSLQSQRDGATGHIHRHRRRNTGSMQRGTRRRKSGSSRFAKSSRRGSFLRPLPDLLNFQDTEQRVRRDSLEELKRLSKHAGAEELREIQAVSLHA